MVFGVSSVSNWPVKYVQRLQLWTQMGSRQCKLLSDFCLLFHIQSFCVILKLNKSWEFAIFFFIFVHFSLLLASLFILWQFVDFLQIHLKIVRLKVLETIFHFHLTTTHIHIRLWWTTFGYTFIQENVTMSVFGGWCFFSLSSHYCCCYCLLLLQSILIHFNWRFWTRRVKITRERAEIKHSLQIHCISKHRISLLCVCTDAITNKLGVSRDVAFPFCLDAMIRYQTKRECIQHKQTYTHIHLPSFLMEWTLQSIQNIAVIQYCIDNVHFVDILHNVRNNSTVIARHTIHWIGFLFVQMQHYLMA